MQVTNDRVVVETAKEQGDNPYLTYEMVKKRGGFCLEKKEILRAFLKAHLKEGDIHSYGKGEAGLARLIASCNLLYVKVGKWYKVLDERTMITYLRSMKREVEEEIAAEAAGGKGTRKKT